MVWGCNFIDLSVNNDYGGIKIYYYKEEEQHDLDFWLRFGFLQNE